MAIAGETWEGTITSTTAKIISSAMYKEQPADRRDQLAKDTRRDQRKPDTRDAKPGQKPGTGKRNDNNVFAGRDGDVYRKSDKGWEQRDQNKWSNPAKNENTRKNFENKQPNLDRDNKARQRGAEKTKNFERSQLFCPTGTAATGALAEAMVDARKVVAAKKAAVVAAEVVAAGGDRNKQSTLLQG